MKVKDAQFFTVVSSFLNVYLVKNRSCSSNTVKSYEDALNLLFTFLEGTKDIPRQRVSWSHFTRQNIQEFVDWLEKVRNCSRQTQLQRLAAIRSFVRYGGIVDLRVIAIQTWREFDTENHRLLWLAISQKKNFLFSSRSRTAKSVQDSGIWCFWF